MTEDDLSGAPMLVVIPKQEPPTYTLHGADGEAILSVQPGPRIFVGTDETSDVERIGAAFRRWASTWCTLNEDDGGAR